MSQDVSDEKKSILQREGETTTAPGAPNGSHASLKPPAGSVTTTGAVANAHNRKAVRQRNGTETTVKSTHDSPQQPPHDRAAASFAAGTFPETEQWETATSATAASSPVPTTTETHASQITPPPNTTTTTTSSSSRQYNNNNNAKMRTPGGSVDAVGPRAVHVPGPGFHQGNASFGRGEAAPVEAASRPSEPAFVVPSAELVTEDSIKLVPAREEDDGEDITCRLGRRGCILLMGVQVLVVIVIVVVVVVLLAGGDDGDDDKESIVTTTLLFPTSAPSQFPKLSQPPTFRTTQGPSTAPSVFPSAEPTIFPEPEECEFSFGYLDPIVPRPYQTSVCQTQPNSVELVLLGGFCNRQSNSCFSYAETTSCQDFPQNGVVPVTTGEQVVVLLPQSGQAATMTVGDTLTLQTDNDSLPRSRLLEIHQNAAPPYDDTTILQRVGFEVACDDDDDDEGQILCFTALGALSIRSYTHNPGNASTVCTREAQTDPVEFVFTVSIPPKLPQGETTAMITETRIETTFSNPPSSSHLQGVVLTTTSNRTAVFTVETGLDLFASGPTGTTVTAQFTNATGVTVEGRPCTGTLETFYIAVEGYATIECPTLN